MRFQRCFLAAGKILNLGDTYEGLSLWVRSASQKNRRGGCLRLPSGFCLDKGADTLVLVSMQPCDVDGFVAGVKNVLRRLPASSKKCNE